MIVPPLVTDAVFEAEVRVPVRLPYRIALPEGYDGKKRWPLVLFLHGSGEKGSDLRAMATHGPFKEMLNGRKIPAIVVAPQLPSPEWGWNARGLSALLDSVEKKYRVDPDAISVTGLSLGGLATWQLIALFPRRFSAAAPICGWLSGAPLTSDLKGFKIWGVHGTADQAVPYEDGLGAIAAAKIAGADTNWEKIEGGGHDVWTQTYSRDDFWTWITSARRSSGRRG